MCECVRSEWMLLLLVLLLRIVIVILHKYCWNQNSFAIHMKYYFLHHYTLSTSSSSSSSSSSSFFPRSCYFFFHSMEHGVCVCACIFFLFSSSLFSTLFCFFNRFNKNPVHVCAYVSISICFWTHIWVWLWMWILTNTKYERRRTICYFTVNADGGGGAAALFSTCIHFWIVRIFENDVVTIYKSTNTQCVQFTEPKYWKI